MPTVSKHRKQIDSRVRFGAFTCLKREFATEITIGQTLAANRIASLSGSAEPD
jgi:hypothetical protein